MTSSKTIETRGMFLLVGAMMIAAVALAQAPMAPPTGQAPSPGGPPGGGAAAGMAAMKAPFTPFHIIGDIYYVGSAGLACYLITTPAGNILLDTGYPDMAAMIEGNIRTLGFKLGDTKILINSHAHIDHGGGMAQIKMDTGGQLVAMAEDVPYFENGGHNDVLFGDRNLFPPVHVDRVIHDGDTVTLGGDLDDGYRGQRQVLQCRVFRDRHSFSEYESYGRQSELSQHGHRLGANDESAADAPV